MARNVFLSFAMEDQQLANAFRAQAKSSRSDLEFRDYSVKEPFEYAWKTNVERLLRLCSATICLVGRDTHLSDAVNWELRKSAELGNQLIAVRLGPDIAWFPTAIAELGIRTVPWDIDAIMSELDGARV